MKKSNPVLGPILALGFSLIVTAVASADVIPMGREFQVSTEPVESGYPPAVAVDAEGHFLIVWQARIDFEDNEKQDRIHARAFRPDGRPQGPVRAVDVDPPVPPIGFQIQPAVAATGSGQFVVAWSRWGSNYADYLLDAFEIFARRLGRRAQGVGEQFHVNSLTPFWQVQPAVASALSGDFLVAWVTGDVGDQGPWPEILGARRFAKDGTLISRELQVNNLGTSPTVDYIARAVSVATSLTGESLVVWSSFQGIVARFYNRDGSPRGLEFGVNDVGVSEARNASVAAGEDGNFVVVWSRAASHNDGTEIVSRAINRQGIAGPVHVLGTSRYSFDFAPSVVSDSFGGFVAAWHVWNQLTAPARIAVRELSRTGEPLGDERRFGAHVGQPSLAGSLGGDLVLTWIGRQPADSEPWVWGQRLRRQATPCIVSDTALCLGRDRFQVQVAWRTPTGEAGAGQAEAFTADSTGYFWFFNQDNVELAVKVLDGQNINGHHWVFYTALTTLENWIVIRDTETGATRVYHNPPGVLSSVADVAAFSESSDPAPLIDALSLLATGINLAPESGVATVASGEGGIVLGDRFLVEVSWTDFVGVSGVGRGEALTSDTGYFWFFDSDNLEIVVKVLDGRDINGHFWVFFGALSNVEYTVRVTDQVTGEVWTRVNEAGSQSSVADVTAFGG